MSIND